jgi:hypothetical protein
MKFKTEETIAKAMRKHAHFDSMSPISRGDWRVIHHERAHIALWMLWQSIADRVGMNEVEIVECRTAEENRAFLINCGIADDVVRDIVTDDENWGSY